MKLSLVVPCYNEEGNVLKFAEVVDRVFKKQKFDYEIIFVNDGSVDGTMDKLRDLLNNSNQNIKVINFSRNFGKEAGIYAGLKNSIGDYVSIIDADLQQDPKYVLKMVKFLDENSNYDAVVAYQKVRHDGAILSFFKKGFYRIINRMSETDFVQGASDFRTFRRYMVNTILDVKEYFRFSKGIFSWVGFNNYYMPYDVKERNSGKTSWSFWKLFKYAIDGIVSFSTAPLRLSTFLGFIISFLSIIYLIVVLVQKIFFYVAVPGYATIVGLILLLGGFQLFSIGIIGEYLARTYVETKNRPIYIVREVLTNERETNENDNKSL